MHRFSLQVNTKNIEEYIEKLNTNDIFEFSYEPVIKNIQTNNGYQHAEMDGDIELHVYLDNGETGFPASFQSRLANILNYPSEKMMYEYVIVESYEMKLDDLILDNGWKIIYVNSETEASFGGDKKIYFDPQGAFGTGLHETTQDCLNIILNQNFSGEKVSDLGTGSGILSLAAAKKGANIVDAYDIEDVARQIKWNADLNNLENIRVFQVDLLNEKSDQLKGYQWAFINIGCKETIVLLQIQELLLQSCKQFLISGLVEWNESKFKGFAKENKLNIVERRQTNEWVTLHVENCN